MPLPTRLLVQPLLIVLCAACTTPTLQLRDGDESGAPGDVHNGDRVGSPGGDESSVGGADGPGGDDTSGDPRGGDLTGGDVPPGDALQGDDPFASGDTLQGDTRQGDTLQGDTLQGDTLQGDTLQGDTNQAAASCAAIKAANANAPSGSYMVDPDGAGAIAVHCDMVGDGGGWMLVDASMLTGGVQNEVTIDLGTDPDGGVIITVYANEHGCGGGTQSGHSVFVAPRFNWTSMRARYTFAGEAACWSIFGEVTSGWDPTYGQNDPPDGNLERFNPALDTVRDEVRMGGQNGDAFPGDPDHCDTDPDNFWVHLPPGELARAQAILRRTGLTDAGPAVGTSCAIVAPGTGSPTWWSYEAIYVR